MKKVSMQQQHILHCHFGMNAVALFHPIVEGVVFIPDIPIFGIDIEQPPDPYSYSILNFNQPDFNIKKGAVIRRYTNKSYVRRTIQAYP